MGKNIHKSKISPCWGFARQIIMSIQHSTVLCAPGGFCSICCFRTHPWNRGSAIANDNNRDFPFMQLYNLMEQSDKAFEKEDLK